LIRKESTSCNLCGSNAQEQFLLVNDILFQTGEYHLVRCKQCKLISLNPWPPKDFLFSHNKNVYSIPKGKKEKKFYSFVENIKQIKDNPFRFDKTINGERLLEIGCSSGYTLKKMEKRGWDVYGIDINPAACSYARNELGLKNIFCKELHKVGFENDYFDIVTMHHVLEHVGDPLSLLGNIHQILKKEGKLILEVPNIASFEFRVFREKWGYLSAPRHLYHFTPTTIKKILWKEGFVIESIHYPILIPHLFVVSLMNVLRGRFSNNLLLKPGKKTLFFQGLLFLAFLPLCIGSSIFGQGSSMLLITRKK